MIKRNYQFMNTLRLACISWLLLINLGVNAQIHHDVNSKTIRINTTDKKLALHIDYSQGCKISEMEVNNNKVLAPSGVFSTVQTSNGEWSSWGESQNIKVTSKANQIILEGIIFGDIKESWKFTIDKNKVLWTINRTYLKDLQVDGMAMPTWHFANLTTWKGGILDNGGMVWCKYLSSVNDTYGVHTGGVTFWNEDKEDALKIAAHTNSKQFIAAKYSHDENGAFTCTHLLSDKELKQRHNLSRFVHGKADVFAPFEVKKGNVEVTFEIQYDNYLKTYDRGHLPGIDVSAVRELLNTTGRYGVVDNNIVGANGWITNWKCLHEPFFAQIGLAVNDKNYTQNLSSTLDQERDFATLEDGRVLSRWHDVLGDEIPGTYDKETGYYEAKWGYTVDSQTGYIINTVEQFHQTGDVSWLKAHKESCERALDWLIRRDSNGNGIFEMVNNNVAEGKASDWIDIVWAGFENAFVNAQMYESLKLWAECEIILGDTQKAAYYQGLADRLKEAFNKTVHEGGFWYPEKKQYIYWRDADGTIRGDNLVTPVNFAVIGYGICDDKERIHTILENIEHRTAQENLFHWPLVFDSFKREEVHANNWPFPRYENGDIFPTWGYLGIRSYVKFDKNLALKYVRNILSQYRKDGLSSQRYSRVDQSGLGTDILSGISTTVTALYSDIYGVSPKWNRMGVEPNMTNELNGTRFNYTLRDVVYEFLLNTDDYQLSTKDFVVRSNAAFGVGQTSNQVIYYPGNREVMKLVQHAVKGKFNELHVTEWKDGQYQWSATGNQSKQFTIHGLASGNNYQVEINGKTQNLKASGSGLLTVKTKLSGKTTFAVRPL